MPDVLINVHVLVSEVIPADIQEVWRRVAAFTRLEEWVVPGPSGEQLTSLHLVRPTDSVRSSGSLCQKLLLTSFTGGLTARVHLGLPEGDQHRRSQLR